jgi:ketosteroid isomerase-like protein
MEPIVTTIQHTPAGTVRALLGAIDDRDLAAIESIIAEDVRFRFGNAEPTYTKADFAATAQAFLGSIAGIKHNIVELWEPEDGTVVATMDVHYRRLDGRELTLPCANVFRVRDGLVQDYRIYLDINPVYAD